MKRLHHGRIQFLRRGVGMILVALVLGAAPIAVSAAIKSTAMCCCPRPEACKCLDHKTSRYSDTRLCAGGSERVMPDTPTAVAPQVFVLPDEPRRALVVVQVDVRMPDGPPLEVEVPPF